MSVHVCESVCVCVSDTLECVWGGVQDGDSPQDGPRQGAGTGAEERLRGSLRLHSFTEVGTKRAGNVIAAHKHPKGINSRKGGYFPGTRRFKQEEWEVIKEKET